MTYTALDAANDASDYLAGRAFCTDDNIRNLLRTMSGHILSTPGRSQSVMNEEAKQALLILAAIDPSVTVKYAPTSGTFCVYSRIEIKDRSLLTGTGVHDPDPSKAVLRTMTMLRSIKQPKTVVVNAHNSMWRREYNWNGAAFAEINGKA